MSFLLLVLSSLVFWNVLYLIARIGVDVWYKRRVLKLMEANARAFAALVAQTGSSVIEN